jgi:hypothetical protein
MGPDDVTSRYRDLRTFGSRTFAGLSSVTDWIGPGQAPHESPAAIR